MKIQALIVKTRDSGKIPPTRDSYYDRPSEIHRDSSERQHISREEEYQPPIKDESEYREDEEKPRIPKFCPECGTPTEGSKFCKECGERLI